MQMEAQAKAQDDSEEVDVDQIKKKTKYSVDDITMGLDKQMKLSKKKKGAVAVDMQMDLGTKTIKKNEKISALRDKRKKVKSRS
jgi:hypothetical protein